MSLTAPPLNAYLFHGTVIAAHQESRLVDVEWQETGVIKRQVAVVQDTGAYSFPSLGETGLVVGSDHLHYYYLGKLEFNYAGRYNGEVVNPATGLKWPLLLVDAGEVCLSHIARGTHLLFSNTGNFTLQSFIQDGIQYIAEKAGEPIRWLKLASKAISISSNTSYLNIGAVIRSFPVVGTGIVRDLTRTKPAQEILAKVTTIVGLLPIDKAFLHLGDIFIEPVVNGMAAVPKLHTEIVADLGVPAPLRAVLAACNELAGGTEVASIKLDTVGNISVNSTLAGGTFVNSDTQIVLNALAVLLGGNAATAIEPAVKGLTFNALLATFLGAVALGTAVNTPADVITYCKAIGAAAGTLVAALPTTLSMKVRIA
jgi:hypothetical protein